jgi:hypothetical protein
MTDPLNPGTTPESTPPEAAPPPAPTAGPPDNGVPTPGYEPAGPDDAAPAQAVSRETAAAGAEAPAKSRRASGIRWAIALVGLVVVVGVTAAIIALASGRPTPSIAVGYMPDNVVQYGEYRFDLPGDQRQKLAAFLSAFPGFDDQAAIETKLDEMFDRLVAAVSENEQTYTKDIEPWFGGQIAFGMGAPDFADGRSSVMGFTGQQTLFVISIKDKALAADWIEKTAEGNLNRGEYGGAILFTGEDGDVAQAFSIAVNDEAILAGTDEAVRSAVDSKGGGKLADDPEFKAAFGLATHDYVAFQFADYKALATTYVDMVGQSGGDLGSTQVDDEILSLVPAWQGTVGRFENDALVGESAYPGIDVGYDAHNKKSTLLGWAPPDTIGYAEAHDVGAAILALIDRFRQLPELRDSFGQVDQSAGIVGGLDGLFGWWGDTAVVVAKEADGTIGGGLLIAPTDVDKATRLFETLRSFIVLGGGNAGIEVRDVQHGDATITIVDFSAAVESSGTSFPPNIKPEIAYTVTKDIVVAGYGQAFVESVLDAGPGPSLADDARVADLAKRVGEENLGFTFLDVSAIREFVEPLLKAEMPADKWAFYEKEIKPFLLPLDAFASSAREDGDLNRLPAVYTVK